MSIKKAISRETLPLVLIAIVLLLSLVIVGWGRPFAERPSNQVQIRGSEGHDISLSEAADLTRNYRKTASHGSITGESFGRKAIQDLLDQSDCVGIRVYYGRKADGSQALVLVGVASTGADLANGKLVETGFPCPPFCDLTSPLAQ